MVKQERAARTHERFLDASADEFSRHGYAGANLQRIAAHVGMTKGALYAHFPSKDALADVFTSAFDGVGYELLRGMDDGDPPLTSLHRLTVGLVSRIHTDLRFRAGLRLACEDACTRGQVPQLVTDLSAVLTRLVGDAQKQGQLESQHQPERISSLVIAVIFGTYHTAPSHGPGEAAEQVRRVWQFLAPTGTV
ncbi:TetR/AcrR family transcriptional regulator [Streptomyces sp. NPDC005925]|uniref:TetR/AcrR family transcriptional regulator n=1 Tax=Streptomyces sp. NPDC005925 TaxID=3157172 RepID=UPI0033C18500